jgi:hypothetical protein
MIKLDLIQIKSKKMKKRKSYKIIYVIALILDLTLLKLANNYSDNKEQATINDHQYNNSNLTYIYNQGHSEMAFPLYSDINLISNKVKLSKHLSASENIKPEEGRNEVLILQSNIKFISPE